MSKDPGENLSRSDDVQSSLRDRIAAVLDGELEIGLHLTERLADAVIAELNLSTPVEYLSVDKQRRNFMVAGHYTEVVDD